MQASGKARQGAVLTRIVAPRRAVRGEQLAWIAKAARGAAPSAETTGQGAPAGKAGRDRRKAQAPDAWIDLALVARAFPDEAPIEAIPLAAEIARQTIAANRQR